MRLDNDEKPKQKNYFDQHAWAFSSFQVICAKVQVKVEGYCLNPSMSKYSEHW